MWTTPPPTAAGSVFVARTTKRQVVREHTGRLLAYEPPSRLAMQFSGRKLQVIWQLDLAQEGQRTVVHSQVRATGPMALAVLRPAVKARYQREAYRLLLRLKEALEAPPVDRAA